MRAKAKSREQLGFVSRKHLRRMSELQLASIRARTIYAPLSPSQLTRLLVMKHEADRFKVASEVIRTGRQSKVETRRGRKETNKKKDEDEEEMKEDGGR